MEIHPPPLPPDWPFQARPLKGLEVRESLDLPGFGPGWRLEAVPGSAWKELPEPLGGAYGRGGVARSGEVVVRPYRRGGLLRHLNRRIYMSPGRFRRELAVHRGLWAAGFPTVEPLGCAWRRSGLGVEGLYFTRLEALTPWPRCWEAEGLMDQLSVAVRALSGWGLWSPDLNATNVLLDGQGQVRLLDWDRAAWVGGADLMARYRQRLLRSLGKLGAGDSIRSAVAGWG